MHVECQTLMLQIQVATAAQIAAQIALSLKCCSVCSEAQSNLITWSRSCRFDNGKWEAIAR